MPALRSSKPDLQETLKDSSATTTDAHGKRLRGMLVVAEVALSVALLVGAGLLVKSMFVLLRTDYNFNPDGVLTMELKVSSGRRQAGRGAQPLTSSSAGQREDSTGC